jgi:hypothetical protein
MCRFWYDACVNATNQNAAQLFECERARDTKCGNLTIDDSGASSSASASTSAGASSTAKQSGASGASASSTPTPSQGAAANFAQYGAPILAGGLLAVFGIAL